MRTLIEAIDHISACQTHDELVELFRCNGARWRMSLDRTEFTLVAQVAVKRGRRLLAGEGQAFRTDERMSA